MTPGQPGQPTQSVVWRAFVWPAIVALVVAAIIMVERLQVDWTVACTLMDAPLGSCTEENFNMVFAWAPAAFAFGVAHIIGAAGLYKDPDGGAALLERGGKLIAYVAIHVFPAFGWYFFYVGLAAGFLISLTVVGLIVAFPVGAFAAGFVAGMLLALAAGPSFNSVEHAGWKRLLTYYGMGSGIGTLVLIAGQALFDPAFGHLAGPGRPWLTAAGTLAAVALSCVILSVAALKANFPSVRVWGHPDFKSALSAIAVFAAVLVLPVHLMVANGATVFPPKGGLFAPVARHFRGNKPPVASSLALAGLRYVGPRSAIIEREMMSRSRMETITLHKGTDKEVNWGSTVYDPFHQWNVKSPDGLERESIFVIADSGGDQTTLHCKPPVNDRQVCLVSPWPPIPPDMTEQTRALAESGEDGYEFNGRAKNAALGIRYVTTTMVEGSSEAFWGRLYCRLNLVNVTTAALSVHQIIPCSADWVAEEQRVRAYVESLFEPEATTIRGTEGGK